VLLLDPNDFDDFEQVFENTGMKGMRAREQ
jgi:hypothetical protein